MLPSLGEGIDDVEVSEVLVKPNDTLKIDDIIIVLESDKATMEIPATDSGKIIEVFVKTGENISEGQVLIKIDSTDLKESDTKIETDESPKEITTESVHVNKDNLNDSSDISDPVQSLPPKQPNQSLEKSLLKKPLASPSVRKFARELGCEIARVQGTGIKSRITREDVQKYIKSILIGNTAGGVSHEPLPDFSLWGNIEKSPLNKIRRLTGDYLTRSWNTIPHVTQFDKTDITDVNILIRQLKNTSSQKEAKLTLLPFMIKAVVQALMEFPDFNSSLDTASNELILKKYYNIGIAVETPSGLVVPVIKNANEKSIKELNSELFDLSSRARNRKIHPDELKGSTFTITSLGGIGGTYFSPIVNLPEVAILGISRYNIEPVFNGKEFIARTMLPYSLSYDHRVIDGAAAARFTRFIASLLSDISLIKELDII